MSRRWPSSPTSSRSARSRRIASSTVASPPASGCGRRVSEKRLISVSLAASRKSRRTSTPSAFSARSDARQLGERRAAAGIDRDRDPLVAGVAEEVDRLAEQRRRQVVDAVEARVLEDVQRDALAGAGEAADDDELHDAGSITPFSALSPETPATQEGACERHAPSNGRPPSGSRDGNAGGQAGAAHFFTNESRAAPWSFRSSA